MRKEEDAEVAARRYVRSSRRAILALIAPLRVDAGSPAPVPRDIGSR